MPTADDRKHQVPVGGEAPRRAAFDDLSASIRDVVPVADVTERDTLATLIAPTAANPLYVCRADATAGWETEYTTDGTVWWPLAAAGSEGIPYATAAGRATIQGTGSHTAAVAVTFPVGRFTQTPIIVIQPTVTGSGSVLVTGVSGDSASGFTARMATANGADFSLSYPVRWMAMQMTPTDADG